MSLLIRSAPVLACMLVLAACDRDRDVEAQVADIEEKKQQAAEPAVPGNAPPSAATTREAAKIANDERVEIVLLLPDTRTAFQQFQRDGLAMLVGRQTGYKVSTQDAAGEAIRQAEQFRKAIATKPAAIIVSPLDPPALAALMVEANTAGIPVIGLDKRMEKDGCASVVSTDFSLMGRMAAQAVLEALQRKAAEEGRTEVTGRVVQVRGAENSFLSNELSKGFAEGLKAQPGVILVHDTPADWNSDTATQRTAEAFRLQSNIDVIFAHSDTMALGAAKGAEAAGQRENVYVIGIDGLAGQKRGIDLVRQSEIDATVVQPALVDLALQVIVKMRADKAFKPQPAYEIQPVVLVPKNVEQALRTGTYKLPKLR